MDPIDWWVPHVDTARANLTALRFPEDISPDWIKKNLAEMRCSQNYPVLVAHNLMLARELCVARASFPTKKY